MENKLTYNSLLNFRQLGKCRRNKLSENINDWYSNEYPTDTLGQKINPNITFYELFVFLSFSFKENIENNYDIYTLINVSDSLIRERLFARLSYLLECGYAVVYNIWLYGEEFSNDCKTLSVLYNKLGGIVLNKDEISNLQTDNYEAIYNLAKEEFDYNTRLINTINPFISMEDNNWYEEYEDGIVDDYMGDVLVYLKSLEYK